MVKHYTILMNDIDKVKMFVRKMSEYEGNLEIVVGHYHVDARSIMGIMSIDLSRELDLQVPDDHPQLDRIEEDLQSYIV